MAQDKTVTAKGVNHDGPISASLKRFRQKRQRHCGIGLSLYIYQNMAVG